MPEEEKCRAAGVPWLRVALLLLPAGFLMASCSPDERGWCRMADRYTPASGACPAAGVTVAPARVSVSLPSGYDNASVSEFISAIFAGDMSVCAAAPGGEPQLIVYPELSDLRTVKTSDGCLLLAVSVKVRAERAGKVLLDKTYSRSWDAARPPDREALWREELPSFMLDIRRELAAAVE